MTSLSDAVEKARDSFLLSIKDPKVDASLLMDILVQTEKQTPGLFEGLQPHSEMKTSSAERVDWSADYFSRHCWLAKGNFARERVEHLIQVKDYLRKQGVKGFVPPHNSPPPAQTESEGKMTTSFIPSENLQKFSKEGDLLTIRTALRMELYDNRLTTADLKSSMTWTKSRTPLLFEDFAEKPFARGLELDRKNWTSEYFESQIVYLKTNFSEERFLHLIEVREVLRQQGVEGFVALPPKASSNSPSLAAARTHSQGERHQSKGAGSTHSSSELNPMLKTALLIGGAVAALVVLLITLTFDHLDKTTP